MIDYNTIIQKADAKGAQVYGEEAWEKAKKTGQTIDGTTPDPKMVGLAEGDRWTLISNELAKKFENPLDGYTNAKREEEQENLGKQAKGLVEEFNQWTRNLETNQDYTEEAKERLYNSKRREVEQSIRNIGEQQHNIQIQIGKTHYEAMEKAYETLKSEMKPSDLTAAEIAYMQAMLSRDNSEQTRTELANEFNYHLAALKIINTYRDKADINSHELLHPLENQLRMRPSLIKLFDIRIDNMSYYTHQLLRNLNGKIVQGYSEYRGNRIVD